MRSQVIIEGLTLEWPAHERWSKEELLRQYATRPVHVAADTAADRQRINAGLGGHSESVTLAAYLDMMTAEQESCAGAELAANATSYSFDAQFLNSTPEMRRDFTVPAHFQSLHSASSGSDPYLFLGGTGSGLGFHAHGHAWNAVVFGSKRWLLYPPGHRMAYTEGKEEATDGVAWLRDVYPAVAGTPLAPWECVSYPGDVVYVPADWLHATINLGECNNNCHSHLSTRLQTVLPTEESIGIAHNLVDAHVVAEVPEVSSFHFEIELTRSSLEHLAAALDERQAAACEGEREPTAACVSASLELGICMVAEYVVSAAAPFASC